VKLLVRLSQVVAVNVGQDGSVRIEHTPTGSFVRFRADGNVDVYAVRNTTWTNLHGAVLNNCKVLDNYGTRDDIAAAHAKLHGLKEERDASGHSPHSGGPDTEPRLDHAGHSQERRDTDVPRYLDYRPGWRAAHPVS
jgi:hypothetical protein